MTLATSAASRPERRAGFTLIELLVVLGIILILAGILIPVVFHSIHVANRTRIAGDMQTLTVALEQYRTDFGDYPRPYYDPAATVISPDRPNPPTGAELLCRALIGPAPALEAGGAPASAEAKQDGADGPGFRLRTQGKVYGPYVDIDKLRIGDPANPGMSNPEPLEVCFLDIFNHAIVYIPAAARRSIVTAANGYAADDSSNPPTLFPMYNLTFDKSFFAHSDGLGVQRMQILMGDLDHDGAVSAGETQKATGPFILWSAGPDGNYGTDSPTPSNTDLTRCDDVTNFQ